MSNRNISGSSLDAFVQPSEPFVVPSCVKRACQDNTELAVLRRGRRRKDHHDFAGGLRGHAERDARVLRALSGRPEAQAERLPLHDRHRLRVGRVLREQSARRRCELAALCYESTHCRHWHRSRLQRFSNQAHE